MARRQQARIGDAGDAAGLFVIGQDRPAEEVLTNALIDERLRRRCTLVGLEPEFAGFFPEPVRGERWLALFDLCRPHAFGARDEAGPVLAKFGIGCPVELRCSSQPLASALGDLGVKAGEVAELHRDRAVRPTERRGELLDFRVARMQLSERQLEIEVERENRFLFAPAFPNDAFVPHGDLLGEVSQGRKELGSGLISRLAHLPPAHAARRRGQGAAGGNSAHRSQLSKAIDGPSGPSR